MTRFVVRTTLKKERKNREKRKFDVTSKVHVNLQQEVIIIFL